MPRNNSCMANNDQLQLALESASISDLVTINSEFGSIHLVAHIDEGGDGISWEGVDSEENDILLLHLRTKVWVSPMLRDIERNSKYEQAIKIVMDSLPIESRFVLDVGTGTGLLAMLAIKAGATSVYACEMFPWVSDLAKRIISFNHQSNIDVVCAHSSEVTVQSSLEPSTIKQMPKQADVLITELLDSTLLAEGILSTVRDAWNRKLLKQGAKVLPCGATLYAAIVESASVHSLHDMNNAGAFQNVFSRDDVAHTCCGSKTVPVRIQALNDLTYLSDPFVAFEFDFSTEESLPPKQGRSHLLHIPINCAGRPDVVYWWDVVLCKGGASDTIVYSTNPTEQSWQDHWSHAAHTLANSHVVRSGDTLHLRVSHNDSQVFFQVVDEATEVTHMNKRLRTASTNEVPEIPLCICGVHSLYQPRRLQIINLDVRSNKFIAAISTHLERFSDKNHSLVLDVSDGSYLGLLVALVAQNINLGVQTISLEETCQSELLWTQLSRAHVDGNGLNVLLARASQVDMGGVDLLLFDGFVRGLEDHALLSALHFFHLCNSLVARGCITLLLKDGTRPHHSTKLIPRSARIVCAAFNCPQIILSYGPVGHVCGFSHQPLDDVLSRLFGVADADPLYLRMSEFLSIEIPDTRRTIATFDYEHLSFVSQNSIPVLASEGSLCATSIISVPYEADVLVFWVDYEVEHNVYLSTGPSTCGQKQAVRLLRNMPPPSVPTPFNLSRPEPVPPNIPRSDILASVTFEKGRVQLGAHRVDQG